MRLGAYSTKDDAAYLVSLNSGNLLVLLDIVADALGELLQSTLRNGLGHLGDLDDGIGIGADGLHHGGKHDERVRTGP